MKLDVVVAGVGGQGVITLASTVVRAALLEGYDAHFLAQSGLAQLGAPVFAHIRVGTPAGPSPKIPRTTADLVIGLERLEAHRLPGYLRPGGHALLSEEAVRPYAARFHPDTYPAIQDIEECFGEAKITWIPAHELASRHGTKVLASAVMLGALAGMSSVVDRDHLVWCLRESRPQLAEVEVEAFFEGYRFITGKDH